MRTVIYTRLSKDKDGDELGVGRQYDDCCDLAGRLDWTIVATFSDNDISAYSGKARPGFEALLAAMKNGETDALIVWHTDRLYRSMRDLERLIDIAEVGRIQLRTVNSGDLDLSTSAGRMVARILGSVARQESEHHGERRREANQQRRLDGNFNTEGYRSFGYTRDGTPLEPEASALKKAAQAVLTGTSLRSIAMDWNARGLLTSRGKQWSNLTLRRVLTKPVYAGLVTYRGHTVDGVVGQWEPLWDEQTHHGLVTFLKDPSRRTGLAFERKHMGSGIYRCGVCGNKMYAAYPHGRGRTVVYICKPFSHVARVGAPLDALIEALVLEYLGEHGVGAGLRETGTQADLGAMRARREGLTARKDELSALLRDGVLTGPAVRRDAGILQEQIDGIDSVLAEAARVSPIATLIADNDQTLHDAWDAASPDIRGKIVAELMDVVVMPGRRGARGFDPDLIDIRWH